ncbi:tyrosine-type recombinase/integrase [Halovivax cerinus]|uniref:Tyrosine-type recombinase/integrase n=1 Tax=Halovivax cerinus TaxID=1487865 RepID=A0ABD5NQC4_9EURY|nr:site-specific integrase [Halovivax cerinus]
MTEALVDAIAKIDDPDTIKQILVAAGVESSQDLDASSPDQPSLSSLYDRYLSRRKNRSSATRAQYKRTIPPFIDFAETRNVSSPAGLSTELLDNYVAELNQEFKNDSTILTYTKNVRTWLRWLSKRDYCDDAVYRILDKEELGLSPTARDHAIPTEEAQAILGKLRKQRRGSAQHALTELLWNTGARLSCVHSLDIDDFNKGEESIKFRHRPNAGTRLKNGSLSDGTAGDGERDVIVNDRVVKALTSYINNQRPDIRDDHGRAPLFATRFGRAAKSTLRRWVYDATSCRWAKGKIESKDCDAACDPDSNVCPCSYYPHAIRRGAIVHHLSNGLRRDRASERFDVSIPVLTRHYDPRSEKKLKEDRAEAVRNSW